MTREEFLAEAQRRGYRREWILFYPGPDEQRDPEGGLVVQGPSERTGGRWRTYRMDRGVKDEAFFADEADAYRHVLDAYIGRTPPAPRLTREQFLADVERRGGRRGWFVFLPEEAERDREGRMVIERTDAGWQVYRYVGAAQDVALFDDESAALRHAEATLFGRPES